MKMEVFNEYLMGSWTVSNNIINSLLTVGCKARIYLILANGESEIVDISHSEIAPKKPAHKNIHIQKPTIVACPKSHNM
jgi:hypothetical protein